MKALRLFPLVLFAVMLAQVETPAWSGPGHAAVAAMAYRQLSDNPALRTKLVDLLKKHPAFNKWRSEYNQASFPGVDFGMFLFIKAANWPDEIRDSGSQWDHEFWHYVNYPLRPPAFSTQEADSNVSPRPGNDVLFGIGECRRVLANTNETPLKRAVHLSWLIHLVGDIHQPLHIVALITQSMPNVPNFSRPFGDRGGGSFLIYQNPAQEANDRTTKLHGYWDGRLGADAPAPVVALQNARMLESTHQMSSLTELGAGNNFAAWSFESRADAVRHVYRFNGQMIGYKRVLPTGYVSNSHQVARRRLALAGYRLAGEMRTVAF